MLQFFFTPFLGKFQYQKYRLGKFFSSLFAGLGQLGMGCLGQVDDCMGVRGCCTMYLTTRQRKKKQENNLFTFSCGNLLTTLLCLKNKHFFILPEIFYLPPAEDRESSEESVVSPMKPEASSAVTCSPISISHPKQADVLSVSSVAGTDGGAMAAIRPLMVSREPGRLTNRRIYCHSYSSVIQCQLIRLYNPEGPGGGDMGIS